MKTNLIVGIVLFLLIGCIQVPPEVANKNKQLAVSSVWDKQLNIEKSHTFALVPHFIDSKTLDRDGLNVMYQVYQERLKAKVISHGHLVSNTNPDLVIGYGIALAEDMGDKELSAKFGITPGLNAHHGASKGSLFIYIEDALTRERVWRATVQGFVQQDLSAKERVERADQVVDSVLSHFFIDKS